MKINKRDVNQFHKKFDLNFNLAHSFTRNEMKMLLKDFSSSIKKNIMKKDTLQKRPLSI